MREKNHLFIDADHAIDVCNVRHRFPSGGYVDFDERRGLYYVGPRLGQPLRAGYALVGNIKCQNVVDVFIY